VWDVSTGKVQSVLEGHTDWVTSVAFSSDGTRIVSGSRDQSMRVWDLSTGKVQSVLEGHTRGVSSVAFSSDGTCILLGSGNESVRISDLQLGPHTAQEDWNESDSDHLKASTGWLLLSNGEDHVMFVPPSANLPPPPCILVLSNLPSSCVLLDNAALGSQWHKCHSPMSACAESG
jgi:WD40 repeat protein